MTRPRKELISATDTPYYHCVSRCVRRAFLCGSGKDYDFEHRRGWIVNRLKQLAAVFCIDITAYAIMSNHYHVVLRVNTERCNALSMDEVIVHWRQLFKGPYLIQQYATGASMGSEELRVVEEIADDWRQRLMDISWFMRCLNEPIARWANREDNCTGRFWEGRFKSQALLDERALISCMAYVDLNPIRACMADKPETSDYTSIQERLGIEPAVTGSADTLTLRDDDDKQEPLKLAELLPFAGNEHMTNKPEHIPFDLMEYIQLVDWTGRAVRENKRGAISSNLPSILDRLGIAPNEWLETCCHIERNFGRAIGPVAKITDLCDKLGQRWIHGLQNCRRFYATQTV